jgi:uncharacterized membrane protein YphA (DoxX/SURF4 family)
MNGPREPWHPLTRIAFRFVYVLLGMSSLKLLATFFPWDLPFRPYWFVWEKLINKLSPLVFHITPVGMLQASDSLTGWMLQLWTLTIALAATVVWTSLAEATEYRRLNDAHRTLVRYCLSCVVLRYGLVKIFPFQFWQPTPTDMIQTFAGSSPFALVWRFIGFSSPYQIFGGVLEVLGATLLLWRRTTTLGALVLAGVMSNVVMLNICYQIPVKNISGEILLLALWLLLPETGRLFAVILSRRPSSPPLLRPFPLAPRANRVRLVAKAAWLVGVVGTSIFLDARAWHRHAHAAKPALWGAYDVETFTVAGVTPPANDAKTWRQVAFGKNWTPAAAIVTGDGEYHLFGLVHDAAHGLVKLGNADSEEDPKPQTLIVRTIDATHLEVDGTFDDQRVHARLRQRDLSKATLNRGFHLVDDGGYWR